MRRLNLQGLKSNDIGDYGIAANVVEPDRVFRNSAKVWIAGGTGGEGWHRFQWIGISRGGRIVRKWAPTLRFGNFRAKWIPEHLKTEIIGTCGVRGNKEQMIRVAEDLNRFVEAEQSKHPNRK